MKFKKFMYQIIFLFKNIIFIINYFLSHPIKNYFLVTNQLKEIRVFKINTNITLKSVRFLY